MNMDECDEWSCMIDFNMIEVISKLNHSLISKYKSKVQNSQCRLLYGMFIVIMWAT